ncbi:cyclase family protein [Enterococcus faecalis]|uniref:cyclase family protein n=1 Tax=Enterococcus faecalis TaxID=1351 RepID=UPI003D6B2523
MDIYKRMQELKEMRWVDLTHGFDETTPRWPGFKKVKKEIYLDFDQYPVRAHLYTFPGQIGTHIDAPAHGNINGMTIDEINLKDCLLPLHVIDCSKSVESNYDYALTVDDILKYENKYGKILEGSFIAMRSDWYKRWDDVDRFLNKDNCGKSHYPGWSIEALKFLVDNRNIAAIGHEPLDTDPPNLESQKNFKGEVYILNQDRYQIEVMKNLDKVPEFGAIIFNIFPKQCGGTGFPVRSFAIFETKIQ